ncbi:carboxymuconolactone decarboxylase family protein [Nocardiopsis gilva YIM 90087]|uniref:Carboxymuconolactone decarboxylase family protein n=1 Tax=Nocardiopsis gilva YIM 90087 TaxID=1235441 RepID=A0A223SAM2_9ACTN|nr:carboxymuconolactone decarboxylase family protein [Nocardiopsis gilva]ASU85181.1 carboxymuconolactone decarboxylase family protein [Nocardiopsis gilva YIM 90087]
MSQTEARARVTVLTELPDVFTSLRGIDAELRETLDHTTYELIKLRASYVNGCAFCIDMHAFDAMKAGESQQRMFLVAAWHEARDHFTEAEQAVLTLTDEVTELDGGVSDEVYAAVARHYSDREIAALIAAIGLINFFNRVAISSGHQPAQRS